MAPALERCGRPPSTAAGDLPGRCWSECREHRQPGHQLDGRPAGGRCPQLRCRRSSWSWPPALQHRAHRAACAYYYRSPSRIAKVRRSWRTNIVAHPQARWPVARRIGRARRSRVGRSSRCFWTSPRPIAAAFGAPTFLGLITLPPPVHPRINEGAPALLRPGLQACRQGRRAADQGGSAGAGGAPGPGPRRRPRPGRQRGQAERRQRRPAPPARELLGQDRRGRARVLPARSRSAAGGHRSCP